ncbi:ATP-binding protein [Catellatospora sp. NEAU-YM18]|nr:ATP-binding protein [Catellatospora tritici]
MFARDAEWASLVGFATSTAPSVRFGVVSGRRRQGKTFLLDALARATGGFYFAASEDTELESLRRFGRTLASRAGTGGEFQLSGWEEAIERLYAVVPDGLIVIDELPYLLAASPSLASHLQRALDPGGTARESKSKLLVCGSAMSVMGGLLSGNAPLRGRASLELVVRPMDYLTAAGFWGVAEQPELALLLHSIVGGTPAYRHEFVHSDAPAGVDDFDGWVVRTVLNPAVPLFREARYLLAEETGARDTALYHGVLGAIALGHNTRGGIAGYLERPSTNISHPLTVLEDCGLITKEADAFRTGRSVYRIAEPLITFYSAVMRRNWSFLERGMAEQAWQSGRDTFRSQVVGPHFEQLCREYALRNAVELFGEPPAEVAAGTVADPAERSQIQVDVVVLGAESGVLCLGEAKWQQTMGLPHLDRLRRARDLLTVKRIRTERVRLACFSGRGFTEELRRVAETDPSVLLVDLPRLYGLAPREPRPRQERRSSS